MLAVGVLMAPVTGHRVVVLRSDSMAPTMPIGSLAIVESVEPWAVRPGDVVTVVLDLGSLLTHRVLHETTLDGDPALILRGDADRAGDIEVASLDRLGGRVTMVVPTIGYAVWWLTQPGGAASSVAFIGLVLVAFGAIGRPAWPAAPRRLRPRAVRRARPTRMVALLQRRVWHALDRPGLRLALTLVLAFGAGATLQSTAMFTTSSDADGNTFTTGAWLASDYRSLATGPWDGASTWQRYNGIAWVVATRAPSSVDGVVTVRSGHVVTVTGDIALDEVAIAAGGQVTVPGGVTMTIDDGAGLDLSVAGTLDVGGTITTGAGATIALESGGILLQAGTVDGAGSLVGRSGTVQASGGARTIGLPITLETALTASGADDLTLGGEVSGSGALVKNGTGTLTLGGANTYTGTTTVNVGTVRLGITDAIGPSSATTVAAGAVLDLNGFDETVGSLAGAGTVTSTPVGGVTLTVGGNGVGTGTFSGVLEDGGGVLALTKIGTGTLTLSGTLSTHTGGVAIDAGVVSATNDRAFGAVPVAPTPARISINGGQLTTTATFTLDPNRGIALTGAATWSVTNTLTYTGIIAGSGSLTKIGAGTLTLGGVSTYTGATTISAGVVSIAAGSALGTPPGSPTPGHLTIGTATLTTTATLTLNPNRGIALTGTGTFSIGAGTTLTYDGVIAGSGALTKAGTGTLTLAGTNTYTGATSISTGVVAIATSSGLGTPPDSPTPGHLTIGTATLTTTADVTLEVTRGTELTGTGTFSIGAGTALTINGVVSGTGAITKTGTGTLALGGANTYAGVTTISAGIVRVQDSDGLGGAGVTTITSGAAIEIDGTGLTIDEPISSLNGTGVGGNGALRNLANANTWSGTVTFGANSTIGIDAGTLSTNGLSVLTRVFTIVGDGDLSVAGAITGTTGSLVKNGTGTLTLGGANTYTGTTTVNVGTVRLGITDAIGPSSATTVAAGAVLDLNGFDETVGSLAGAGTVTSTPVGGVTLTVGGNGVGTGTFSGVLEDGGGVLALTKIGTGTLTLSGTLSTHTGGVAIDAGVVVGHQRPGVRRGAGRPDPGPDLDQRRPADDDRDVHARPQPRHRPDRRGHLVGHQHPDLHRDHRRQRIAHQDRRRHADARRGEHVHRRDDDQRRGRVDRGRLRAGHATRHADAGPPDDRHRDPDHDRDPAPQPQPGCRPDRHRHVLDRGRHDPDRGRGGERDGCHHQERRGTLTLSGSEHLHRGDDDQRRGRPGPERRRARHDRGGHVGRLGCRDRDRWVGSRDRRTGVERHRHRRRRHRCAAQPRQRQHLVGHGHDRRRQCHGHVRRRHVHDGRGRWSDPDPDRRRQRQHRDRRASSARPRVRSSRTARAR